MQPLQLFSCHILKVFVIRHLKANWGNCNIALITKNHIGNRAVALIYNITFYHIIDSSISISSWNIGIFIISDALICPQPLEILGQLNGEINIEKIFLLLSFQNPFLIYITLFQFPNLSCFFVFYK